MACLLHILITRFNLKLYDRDKNNAPTRTVGWLEHRFDIFEYYCLPSVAGQTCPGFTWICLFDKETPVEYKKRIASYQDICPQFTPVFYDEKQTANLAYSLRDTIMELGAVQNEPPQYILTTNLDNDDSLSKYAISELQKTAERHGYDGKIYSWLSGYQYFEKERLVVKMHYTNNHFLTLAEPYSAEIQTILSYNHAMAIKQLPFVFVKTKQGMWLETVHRDNVSNELRINSKVLYIPILKGFKFKDFGFDLHLSCLSQLVKSLFIFPFAFLFMAVKRLATKRKRRKEFNQLSRV